MKTVAPQVRPCSLDAPTQDLLANISSKDMFSDAMNLMTLGEGEQSGRVAGAWGWQGLRLLTLPTPTPPPRHKEDTPGNAEPVADYTGSCSLREAGGGPEGARRCWPQPERALLPLLHHHSPQLLPQKAPAH